METIEVPAGHGRAFNIVKGSRFRLTTPQGQQSADFFAFCADDISEGLSPHHTWMPTRSLHPRVGDPMLSRKRRPMVELVEDGAAVAEITHVAGARVVLDNGDDGQGQTHRRVDVPGRGLLAHHPVAAGRFRLRPLRDQPLRQ